jgi:hypothetical protein
MGPWILLRTDFRNNGEIKPPGTIILGVLGHKPNGQSLKATELKSMARTTCDDTKSLSSLFFAKI